MKNLRNSLEARIQTILDDEFEISKDSITIDKKSTIPDTNDIPLTENSRWVKIRLFAFYLPSICQFFFGHPQ